MNSHDHTHTYLVTGAGGFVGRNIAIALRAQGHRVIGLARGNYPELHHYGIDWYKADLGASSDAWKQHFCGVDGVFHVAAKVEMWGSYRDFETTNVLGTKNVLDACLQHGVRRLVYTSSPSVIADGKDLLGVDENYPYPRRHMAFYPATKAIAERMVLSANSTGTLSTLALRPHLIFGPGDSHFIPLILKRARAGRLVRVGSGKNLTDLTYIEDCTAAHLAAMHGLEQNPDCRGKCYFISQGEPVNMWNWIEEVLARSGVGPIRRSVSTNTAFLLAGFFELLSAASFKTVPPLFTRFLVSQMSTSHYFNIKAAQRDFGFSPRFTMAEAMDLTFGGSSFFKPFQG